MNIYGINRIVRRFQFFCCWTVIELSKWRVCMPDKELVNFEIERVFAGWFDASFIHEKKKITISASDVYGNDGPKILLEKFIEFYQEDVPQKIVVWDEEPGCYFIIFTRTDKDCSMSISYSEEAEDALRGKTIDEIDDFSKNQLSAMLQDLEDLLVVENIDIYYLLKIFYERFSELDLAEYQNHWMDYPSTQLEKMKTIMDN